MRIIGLLILLPVFLLAQEKLTEEQAQALIDSLRAEEQSLQSQIQSCQSELEALRSDVSSQNDEITRVEQEVSSLQNEVSKYPSEYKVKRGDFLAKIAEYKSIYGTYKGWPRIWRANMDKIKDPDLIYPDWILKIPHGLDRTYKVIRGDYLWKIARFWWIYRNGRDWPKLYNANKDKIKNPDLIYPGQVLTVPR